MSMKGINTYNDKLLQHWLGGSGKDLQMPADAFATGGVLSDLMKGELGVRFPDLASLGDLSRLSCGDTKTIVTNLSRQRWLRLDGETDAHGNPLEPDLLAHTEMINHFNFFATATVTVTKKCDDKNNCIGYSLDANVRVQYHDPIEFANTFKFSPRGIDGQHLDNIVVDDSLVNACNQQFWNGKNFDVFGEGVVKGLTHFIPSS